MYDLTEERWFHDRKTSRPTNILLDLVRNFDYLQAFGNNTFEQIKQIRGIVFDYPSGHFVNWDGRATCDRCGAFVIPNGYTKSIRLAYGMVAFPRLKHVCLCPACDKSLDDAKQYLSLLPLWGKQPPMPNDWKQYAWL